MEKKLTNIKFEKVDIKATIPYPKQEGDAGYDLHYPYSKTIIIASGDTIVVPIGLKVELPDNWEMQIRSRSGMALKGIVVANSPGTIDSKYRDEIGVILRNNTNAPYKIEYNERIAQCVFKPTYGHILELTEVDKVLTTDRTKGFGSSGK